MSLCSLVPHTCKAKHGSKRNQMNKHPIATKVKILHVISMYLETLVSSTLYNYKDFDLINPLQEVAI